VEGVEFMATNCHHISYNGRLIRSRLLIVIGATFSDLE